MGNSSQAYIKDETLIQNYLKGDGNSLGVLYERYIQKIYYKCLSFSKNNDDAYDLSHDVIMKAFSKIHTFRNDSLFSTWLYSITHNHCIEQYRKKINYENLTVLYNSTISDEEYDAETDLQEEKRKAIVTKILDEAPEQEKQILINKYLKNMSITELQKEMNLSASAVKMRLLRARQKVETNYYRLMSVA